jgi:alanine-synthesizing transaminase
MFSERTSWDRSENALTLAVGRLKSSGKPLLDLTRSNPTECAFEYDERAIQRALTAGEFLRYRPEARGMAVAREAVAAYYGSQHGVALASDDLLLTSGTSEAYAFLFRLLCDTGDEVLIPAPGYPLFDFLADICDVKLARFAMAYDHGWQIDFAALAAAVTVRTRAVIVVHPNNPTGHYVAGAEQRQLADFCRERGMALIADEVFLDFSVAQNSVRSFADGASALTFILSGLSKICGLPQMKLAWLAVGGPEAEKREALARLELIADAYLSVGTPIQLAAPALLAMRAEFQEQARTRVRRNLLELDRQMAQQNVSTRLQCDGGWTAVLRVPAVQSDEALAIALLKDQGVLVHPGHFYDFARPGHIVVSLIVPEPEFARGIGRVLAHVNDGRSA